MLERRKSGSQWLRGARNSSTTSITTSITPISTFKITTCLLLLLTTTTPITSAGRNGGGGATFLNPGGIGINPLVFHKYSLMTPSSSVVGTSAGASTEHLLSYVPAPLSALSGSFSTSGSGISPLPIMSALGGSAAGTLAAAAATLTPGGPGNEVPVTYK